MAEIELFSTDFILYINQSVRIYFVCVSEKFIPGFVLQRKTFFPASCMHFYDYVLCVTLEKIEKSFLLARKKSRCISHSQVARTKHLASLIRTVAPCALTFWQLALDIFSRKSGKANMKQ